MNFHLGGWDQLCSCREEESSPPVEESPFQMAEEALLFSNVNGDPETSYHHRSINLVQPSPKPPKPMTRSQSARTLSNRRSSSLAIEELEELLFQTCMEPELAAVDDRQLVEAAVQQWGPSLQQPIQPSRSSALSSCSQHPLQIGTGLQYLSPARKGGTNPKRRASVGRRSKSTIARRKRAESISTLG